MGLLYSKIKIFHFNDKLNSLPQAVDEILPPIQIRIKPTNVCAHNCWYCAYRADNLQLGKDMERNDYIPKHKILEIIDDIVEMRVKTVTFSGGGDPFYYPYLLDAVKKLSQTSVKFATLTNGSRLEGEIAEVFAYSGTWLRISIDGWDDESYSTYRNVKSGEFSKVMKNIEDFKKLGGKCYLGISLIVDTKNASHVYDFTKRLKSVGVDSVKVSPCIPCDNIEENNNYHKPVFDKVKEDIQRAIHELVDDRFEIYDSYHLMEGKFSKDYSWCPFLQILPIIGADLNVYSCQDKAYNISEGMIGSIKEMRFKDFWFSNKDNFFKINPSVHCSHHCVANAKNKLILEYLGV
ncbi:MAG: radical SAM protein, partial [Candidatus Brocadiales bacterium]|nr:radical SAM protein [Candidatus Brocadiales bacterium]